MAKALSPQSENCHDNVLASQMKEGYLQPIAEKTNVALGAAESAPEHLSRAETATSDRAQPGVEGNSKEGVEQQEASRSQQKQGSLKLTVKNTFVHVGDMEVPTDYLQRQFTAPATCTDRPEFGDCSDTEEEEQVPSSPLGRVREEEQVPSSPLGRVEEEEQVSSSLPISPPVLDKTAIVAISGMKDGNLKSTVKNTFVHVGGAETLLDLLPRRQQTAPAYSSSGAEPAFVDNSNLQRQVSTSSNGNLQRQVSTSSNVDKTAIIDIGSPMLKFSGASAVAMPRQVPRPTSSGEQEWMLLNELPPAFKVQSLGQWLNLFSGSTFINWTVDARKLKGTDRLVVSPVFKIREGHLKSHEFKMTVYPQAVSEGKGGASFKKAGGKGIIQLKCEGEGQQINPISFKLSAGSGRPENPLLEAARGPVTCDFTEKGICGLAKADEVWNFPAVVDTRTQTFVITLEVLASRGNSTYQ